MSQWIRHRFWTPALAAVFGTGIAFAIGIGWGWRGALVSEVVTLIWSAILYAAGGEDTDVGAVLGGRADERQKLVRLRAAQLSMVVTLVAVVVACVIAAAVKVAFWPFEVLAVIIGVAYLGGLTVYGLGREANAEGTEQEDRRAAS